MKTSLKTALMVTALFFNTAVLAQGQAHDEKEKQTLAQLEPQPEVEEYDLEVDEQGNWFTNGIDSLIKEGEDFAKKRRLTDRISSLLSDFDFDVDRNGQQIIITFKH